MNRNQIIVLGIAFLLIGCITQDVQDTPERLYTEAAARELEIPESDIITVINKWNHELVESYDSHYLSSWMLADLMDPVVYDIVDELHAYGYTDPVHALQQWAPTREAHTQALPVFAYAPGNDPWGAVPFPWGGNKPVYKKLLPSEMKAMSIFSGKITGKCMTLATLNVSLFRLLGAEAENVVVIRTETHGVGLARIGGKTYFINNNTIREVDDSAREWITSQTFAGLWTESISATRRFTITDDILDSQDTLLDAIWKENWGKKVQHTVLLPDKIQREDVFLSIFGESNAENKLAVLTKYAYQSLYVKKPELYLRASLRSPKAKELAGRLRSADDIIEWIQTNIAAGSIFADYQDRIMVADQVIVFKTGGPKDQAVLAFTLLKLNGFTPVLTITTDSVYLEVDGTLYDVQEWTIVDSVEGRVELILHLMLKEERDFLRLMLAFQGRLEIVWAGFFHRVTRHKMHVPVNQSFMSCCSQQYMETHEV
jgi:hypothetical protein